MAPARWTARFRAGVGTFAGAAAVGLVSVWSPTPCRAGTQRATGRRARAHHDDPSAQLPGAGARGRVAIESKDDVRKRGVKSPDRAEAIMLAFAAPALGWTLLDYESKWTNPLASLSSARGSLSTSRLIRCRVAASAHIFKPGRGILAAVVSTGSLSLPTRAVASGTTHRRRASRPARVVRTAPAACGAAARL